MKQLGVLSSIVIGLLGLGLVHQATAVFCWKRRFTNGTCAGLLSWRIPESKCCEAGGEGIAFSPKFQANEIFKMLFVKTAPCQPCQAKSCSSTRCDTNKRCIQSAPGSPQCICAPDCSATYNGEVCGSDGMTYKTECAMLTKSCQSGVKLTTEYRGKCVAACQGVVCPVGKLCIPGHGSRSYCIQQRCPGKCGSPGQPAAQSLCGTDGVTYASQCHLQKQSCRQSQHVSVAYLGPCRAGSSCRAVRCPGSKTCVLDLQGKPRCITCQCISDDFTKPLCGKDGTKYLNWCQKRRVECQQRQLIALESQQVNCGQTG